MTVYYVDSSVWVKRYYEETGTSRAQELFSGEHVLVCSTLGLVEVAATLSRKQRAAELSIQGRDKSLAELERDWQQFVQIDVVAEIIAEATRLARDFALRGSDAIHLASALAAFQRLAGSEHQAVLATSDQELKRAAGALGVVLLDPEEPTRP
jgi:predicted nucleic acid-binding protein